MVNNNNDFNRYFIYVIFLQSCNIISGERNSFIELITVKDGFIDRSLLLEKIVEGPKVRLITLPGPWGKTTNLDMMEFFLQTKRDEQGRQIAPEETDVYKYFVKGIINTPKGTYRIPAPRISTNKLLVNRSLANSDVIKLNFGEITGEDFNTFFNNFTKCIATIFEKHHSVENELEGWALEAFQKIRNNEEDVPEEIEKSIKFLTEALTRYCKRQIFIFIDDYDKFLCSIVNDIMQVLVKKHEKEKILKFIKSFMEATFKENYFYWAAVITGTTPLAGKHLRELVLNAWSEHDETKMQDLDGFYGIVESQSGR